MLTRKIELLVGVFVAIAIAAGLMLSLYVANQGISGDQETYQLKAKFDNIGGLVVRSKVSVAGVIVGQVRSIELDQETFMARVELELDASINQIPVDSTAAILTDGLLGGKFIGLSIGAEEEVLKDGDEIYDTQSAIILEELIGKFLLNAA